MFRLSGLVKRAYDLALYATPVDSKVSQIREELLSSVLSLNKFEEIWGIINELHTPLVSDRRGREMKARDMPLSRSCRG